MDEFHIAVRDRYSSLSDAELDEEVIRIKQEYPNAGIKITIGMCVTVRCVCIWVCTFVAHVTERACTHYIFFFFSSKRIASIAWIQSSTCSCSSLTDES